MAKKLETIVKNLSETYKSISIAGNMDDPNEFISTGNLSLDLALEGGIAWGYAAEHSGKSGSGKTLMLQKMLADAQKKYDAIGIWIDRENAWFNKRAIELGIDLNRVILLKPRDVVGVPQATAAINDILSKIPINEYKFVAIDSISSFAKEGDKSDMGKKAQSLHNLFRMITGFLDDKMSLNFTNQVTFKIGVLFGNPETVTGGEAPKYYTTYRIKLDDKKEIKDANKGNEIVGNWVEAQVIKTRTGPNLRKVVFPFYYKEGIPYYGGLARLLASKNILIPHNKEEFRKYNQHTLKYGDESVNEFKIEKFLEKHPEIDISKWPEYTTKGEDNETTDNN